MTKRIALLIALLVVLATIAFAATHDPWTGVGWDVASPDIDQPIGNHYKELYDLRKGVALRMNKEHETLATSSAGGVHKQGSARAFFQDAEPTTQVNGDAFDSGDLGSLWFDSNSSIDNTFYVLTATTPTWTPVSTEIIATLLASDRTFAGATTFTGAVTANGGITLGADDDLIGSATSDITWATNKFTVAGATGNTLVAGTLDVTGVATVGDGSLTKTSAAPSTDAMIANKKYVDDQIAAYIASEVTLSAYATTDSDNAAMVEDHAYLATSDGFVYAVGQGNDAQDMQGYIDGTSNPAGAGELVAATNARSTNDFISVNFAVASGEYFEITSNLSVAAATIYWRSMGTLSKPVDQD